MLNNNSYVYALLDPRFPGYFKHGRFVFKYQPFYIGKGTGSRAYSHLKEMFGVTRNERKEKVIRAIRKKKLEPIVSIKKSELSNAEAFELERKLVLSIGRLDLKTGPLANKNDGGAGGPSNRKVSDAYRQQVSERYWNKDEATRLGIAKKRSDTLLNKTPVEKAKISKKLSDANRNRSDEAECNRVAKIKSGISSFWNSLTQEQKDERRRKISEGRKRYWASLSEVERSKAVKKIRADSERYHRNLDAKGIKTRSEQARKASMSRQLFKEF